MDIWLLHNIITYGSGRTDFSNCTFNLEKHFLNVAELTGSVKLVISGSIIYPSLAYMDPRVTDYFTTIFNADTIKDFPTSNTIIRTHTFVNLLNQERYIFNIMKKISFSVQTQDAPIFAIRI